MTLLWSVLTREKLSIGQIIHEIVIGLGVVQDMASLQF